MSTKSSKLQIIIPLLTLIIGIAVGYYIPSFQEDDVSVAMTNNRVRNNLTAGNFLHSIKITNKTADSMIKRYREQNDKAIYRRLRTDSGKSLHGFWIPRLILDTILNQPNETVNGLRIYFGKRSDVDKHKRIYTLILLGTSGPKNSFLGTDGNTDISGNGKPIYDHVDPCPPSCGSLGQ